MFDDHLFENRCGQCLDWARSKKFEWHPGWSKTQFIYLCEGKGRCYENAKNPAFVPTTGLYAFTPTRPIPPDAVQAYLRGEDLPLPSEAPNRHVRGGVSRGRDRRGSTDVPAAARSGAPEEAAPRETGEVKAKSLARIAAS